MKNWERAEACIRASDFEAAASALSGPARPLRLAAFFKNDPSHDLARKVRKFTSLPANRRTPSDAGLFIDCLYQSHRRKMAFTRSKNSSRWNGLVR